MPSHSDKLNLLICYIGEMQPIVRELSDRLADDGFDPHLDLDLLLPDADRETQLLEAMRRSDAILLCASSASTARETELRQTVWAALEMQKSRPGSAFLIPVQLEPCELPALDQDVRWERYFEPGGYDKICQTLKDNASRTGTGPDGRGENLPPGSYVPFPRDPLFTGREDDLATLHEILCEEEGRALITQPVPGTGGIGKTALAVEFAYRYRQGFKGIHWLDLRDPSLLDAQIALCGSRMGFENWPDKQPQQVELTLQAWRAAGPRLLILDNFKDSGRGGEVLGRFEHPALCTMVVSRRHDFPRQMMLQIHRLNLFTEAESQEFFSRRGVGVQGGTGELAALLGHLPLALKLAASAIKDGGDSLADYLGKFAALIANADDQAAWFKELRIIKVIARDRSLLTAFRLAWERVQDEASQNIFKAAGYCAAEAPIPAGVFAETLGLDEAALAQSLERLRRLGLLNGTANRPQVHALTAAFARSLQQESKDILEKLAGQLALMAIDANAQREETGDPQAFALLRPHLFAAAGYAERACIQEAGTLFWNLGYFANRAGDYPEARASFERALQIDEIALGLGHPNVALDVSSLGKVLQEQGELAEARAAFEHALKIDEAASGPNDPQVATDLGNLGAVLRELGDLNAARKAYERALKIKEAAFGQNHASLAPLLEKLGETLQFLGDLEGAKRTYGRALMINEKRQGPIHPTAARLAASLGATLQGLGDLPAARTAFERALYITEIVRGPVHPEVALGVSRLGRVLQFMGDLPGAKAAYQRALQIFQETVAPEHPDLQAVRKNLQALE